MIRIIMVKFTLIGHYHSSGYLIRENFWLRRKCQIFLQFPPIYQSILVLWCPIFGHPEMGSFLDQWYRIVQYFRIVASIMHFSHFQKNIYSYNRPDICPPWKMGLLLFSWSRSIDVLGSSITHHWYTILRAFALFAMNIINVLGLFHIHSPIYKSEKSLL